MDRRCSPTTPKSFLILPMHLRLEASETPGPAGLIPPSLSASFLHLSLYPWLLPQPLMGKFSQGSSQAGSAGGEWSVGSSVLVGQGTRERGGGALYDEESLPSLVSGCSGWSVQEVRFVVKSRSKFSGRTIISSAQVVTNSGGNSSQLRAREQLRGGRWRRRTST